MTKNKKTIIRLKLARLETDPVQYKPWSPTLELDNVHVDIPVDAEEVTKITTLVGDGRAVEGFVLSLAGLKMLMKEVGHTILQTNQEFDNEILKLNKGK